jgi:signal transduction histidine kinase
MNESITLSFAFIALGCMTLAGAQHRSLRWRMEQVARACHELRGPVTAVQLAVYGLQCQRSFNTDQIGTIEHELHRIHLGLCDLNAVHSGQQVIDHIESVNISGLIRQLVIDRQAFAQNMGTELSLYESYPSVIIFGNRLRLVQACGNLIANAIEHGGEIVEVGLEVAANRVRIIISDNGCGLPCSLSELVRKARYGRGQRGRGIAIAAEIIAKHNGSLSNEVGDGVRLVVELPVGQPKQSSTSSQRDMISGCVA